ncbi:MAG: ABC transporter ATP-binding protein [Synergistaceae bacterium]|jgi:iron(III) transport system ATP-binding protein|nr:ABC transporter ATP-binding protein [Synergistaceae bacterium]
MSTAITFSNVVKKYAKNVVIPALSLEVRNGEFFTLLGPSGCGKTTLLRMVAGFNSIESGEILFDNIVINQIPANKRNIGMVFQNYAIFPHMTVGKNVEYGLRLRKTPKQELKARTDEILARVKIEEYRDSPPERLSGGQQQRVALARAIVINPKVLLMDEPLSNLDAKLRVEMRGTIREIQRSVGITTIYVTHDQEEALAISDRIAIMDKGVIMQVGTPRGIYQRPYNVFVATFIGFSNLFDAVVGQSGAEKTLEFSNGYTVPIKQLKNDVKAGEKVRVSVRPEDFVQAPEGDGIRGTVRTSTFLGRYVNYQLIVEGQEMEFVQDLRADAEFLTDGQEVWFSVAPEKINVFDQTGGHSLIEGVVRFGS